MNAGLALDASVVIGLLLLVTGIVAINLLVGLVLWWRHVGLADRVTKLEVHNEHRVTREEVRHLFDRIATLEGKVDTTNTLLHTVQEHLLEND